MTTEATAQSAPAKTAATVPGDSPPKLRTRLKQKVKSFLQIFRGGARG